MQDNATPAELALIKPAADRIPALQIFHELPAGFVAFALDDGSAEPLVMPGEIIVADVNDRDISVGGIYLRRIVSGNGHARLCVNEVFKQPQRQLADDDTWYMADAFYFVSHNPAGLSEKLPAWAREEWPSWAHPNGGRIAVADGPFYQPLSARHLQYWRSQVATVVGRVVGILSLTPASGAEGRPEGERHA